MCATLTQLIHYQIVYSDFCWYSHDCDGDVASNLKRQNELKFIIILMHIYMLFEFHDSVTRD